MFQFKCFKLTFCFLMFCSISLQNKVNPNQGNTRFHDVHEKVVLHIENDSCNIETLWIEWNYFPDIHSSYKILFALASIALQTLFLMRVDFRHTHAFRPSFEEIEVKVVWQRYILSLFLNDITDMWMKSIFHVCHIHSSRKANQSLIKWHFYRNETFLQATKCHLLGSTCWMSLGGEHHL